MKIVWHPRKTLGRYRLPLICLWNMEDYVVLLRVWPFYITWPLHERLYNDAKADRGQYYGE